MSLTLGSRRAPRKVQSPTRTGYQSGRDSFGAELLADRHIQRVVDRQHDERRHVECERVAQARAEVVGGLAAPCRQPERLRELDEVRVGEVDAEVLAELLVLLPDDRAELLVL